MTREEVATILETSDQPKLLASAAEHLAKSGDAADHQLLMKWLPTSALLLRLNTEDEYDGQPERLRVRRPLEALRDNSAPVAREDLLKLTQSPQFVASGSRVELLIEASVSVRPPPPELVDFWDKYSQPDDGFTPITIKVLVDNGTRPALELFRKKVLDSRHAEADKISWLRADVLTHRNQTPVLECSDELLKGALSSGLKSALVDVLFDYRPGEWFRPGNSYDPPPPSSYSPDARHALQGIGRWALEHVELTERQRAAVQATIQASGPGP